MRGVVAQRDLAREPIEARAEQRFPEMAPEARLEKLMAEATRSGEPKG